MWLFICVNVESFLWLVCLIGFVDKMLLCFYVKIEVKNNEWLIVNLFWFFYLELWIKYWWFFFLNFFKKNSICDKNDIFEF